MVILGVTGFPKMDVFLENSQTAFDPPPSFLEITLRFFPKKFDKNIPFLNLTNPQWIFLDRKWPPPPFLEITLRLFLRKFVNMR